MGRPVKIFRVYYADSMGEPDLPLAMWPCPPMAWAFFASLCSSALSVWAGLGGCLGLVSCCRNTSVAAARLGLGSPEDSGPFWDGASQRVQQLSCKAVLCQRGFCCLGHECHAGGPCLDRVSVLLCLRTLSLCIVLVLPVLLPHTQGQRTLGCWAGPPET